MNSVPEKKKVYLDIFLKIYDIVYIVNYHITAFNFKRFDFTQFPFRSKNYCFTIIHVYMNGYGHWRYIAIITMNHSEINRQLPDASRVELSAPNLPDASLEESSFDYEPPQPLPESETNVNRKGDECPVKVYVRKGLHEHNDCPLEYEVSADEGVEKYMDITTYDDVKALKWLEDGITKLIMKGITKLIMKAIFFILWFVRNHSYDKTYRISNISLMNHTSSIQRKFDFFLSAMITAPEIRTPFRLAKLVCRDVVLQIITGVTLGRIQGLVLGDESFTLCHQWSLKVSIPLCVYLCQLQIEIPNIADYYFLIGFVGLFNVILLWPGFLLLDLLDWEKFEWPNSEQLMYMAINGIIGTVLSELLWLWGCFLTSSLMATLSLSLTIPLTMAVDTWLKGIHYSWLFYVGAIPMMISFLSVTLFTHYETWDPVWDGINALYSCICQRNTMYSLVDSEIIERESLIEDSNCGITNLGLEDDDDDSISDGDIGDAQVRDLDEVDKRSIGSASDSFSSHQQSNGLTASVQSTVVSSNIMNHV
ncbi:unnamed protein product, partial [Meganyctiphanes norvegica]